MYGKGEFTMIPEEKYDLFSPDEPEEKQVIETTGEEAPEPTSEQEAPADKTANEPDKEQEQTDVEEQEETEEKPKKNEWTREAVERTIEKRLQRDRRVREREFSEAAGVPMTHEDAKKASALWGFLIQHPEINEALGQLVEQGMASGRIRVNQQAEPSPIEERQKALDLKEAVIDLRAQDSVFRANEANIMEWAEINDYEIDDPKSLKLAYLAWKGENAGLVSAKTAAEKAEREAAAQKAKEDAQLLPGRGVRSRKSIDYKTASVEEILKAEGLSLFTEEPK